MNHTGYHIQGLSLGLQHAVLLDHGGRAGTCQQVCVEVIDPQQHFADSRLPASLVQNEDLYLPDDI